MMNQDSRHRKARWPSSLFRSLFIAGRMLCVADIYSGNFIFIGDQNEIGDVMSNAATENLLVMFQVRGNEAGLDIDNNVANASTQVRFQDAKLSLLQMQRISSFCPWCFVASAAFDKAVVDRTVR